MDKDQAPQDQPLQHLGPSSGDGAARRAAAHTPEANVPEQQQLATMDAIHDAAKHAEALRAYALPEGSEPAFVFRPVPAPDRPGSEQDHG
jgi:hypothetical protein